MIIRKALLAAIIAAAALIGMNYEDLPGPGILLGALTFLTLTAYT